MIGGCESNWLADSIIFFIIEKNSIQELLLTIWFDQFNNVLFVILNWTLGLPHVDWTN